MLDAVDKAMRDLDWKPKYSMLDGLKDSYINDFKIKKVFSSSFKLFTFHLSPVLSRRLGSLKMISTVMISFLTMIALL
jgi:hypothetical protein